MKMLSTIMVHLVNETSPKIALSKEKTNGFGPDPYRTLRIAEDVTIFLTTGQAIQLADSILETVGAETAEVLADAV
jgi:hypothetical protein